MTEQQEPFGESDQMWVPTLPTEAMLEIPNAVHVNMLRGVIAKPTPEQIVHIYGAESLFAAMGHTEAFSLALDRTMVTRLRNPEPAAVDWAVQHHSFIRNHAQLVRDLHAYADALERVLLPAVKP